MDQELIERKAHEIEARCPLKIRRSTNAGCCSWDTFITDFAGAWPRYIDGMPSDAQWRRAQNNWKRGNTGWEAVQIAMSDAKEAERKATEPKLVNIGGRNWTHEGSVIHQKYLALIQKGDE